MGQKFHFAKDFLEDGDRLMQSYNLISAVTMPERKPSGLTKRENRICRFCKRRFPEVTFRKVAHIIPELLGNHSLISDFECDDCNSKFGLSYEDHFAKFLGISRTMGNIRGKVKVPTFKSHDKKLRAGSENFFGIEDSIVLTNTMEEENAIEFDFATGKGSISAIKQPYIPIWAYKALLKMALSSIEGNEILNYDKALEFLMTEKLDKVLATICNCRCYRMPVGFGIKDPFVLLFNKKQFNERVPTHLFALFVQNSVYEIFIPLNKKDKKLYNGETFSVHWCPPIFEYLGDAENVPVRYYDYDLSSSAHDKEDREILHFEINAQEMKNLVSVNAFTGQMDVNKSGQSYVSKKLIMVPPNSQIDISQFRS